MIDQKTQEVLFKHLTRTICETNGISLSDTLELMAHSSLEIENKKAYQLVLEFDALVTDFQQNKILIHELMDHPFNEVLFQFFKKFPLKYSEEHIHLTGALTADFIYPRLKKLIEGPHKDLYEKKIKEVYGDKAWPIKSVEDVDRLIRLEPGEGFLTYLRILYLPKLILVDRKAHEESAYSMARELYEKYNVGKVRLKFSLSRASSNSTEQIPGADDVSPEDVVLGLYDGFKKFQDTHQDFDFILSPSFRKEASFFDATKYKTRKEHFEAQVNELVKMLDKYPFLQKHMTDVDTVGNENDLTAKSILMNSKKAFANYNIVESKLDPTTVRPFIL
jgi:hypothetical protein